MSNNKLNSNWQRGKINDYFVLKNITAFIIEMN